jgi:S1-C subfamily serine protease
VKALLSTVLVMTGAIAFGAGLTSVQIDGNSYTNITDVHVSSGGRIILLFPGGGTSASADKVPPDFLASWNISPLAQTNAVAAEAAAKARRKATESAERANARAAALAEAENNLEQIIQSGVFREVDGVVYDIRSPESGWVTFQNVKVVQVLDGGAIIDSTPNVKNYKNKIPILVKNLPTISDTDFISFAARPVGIYSYVNKLGDDRTVRAFDVGRICDRSEIPLSVLFGQKAFDVLIGRRPQMADVVASLPDSKNLRVSGSGFFISEDGYLITNAHVVRNARSVKVKTGTDVFPAEVVRVDERDDFALLKVSGTFPALSISTNEAGLGDAVFTIGFPDIVLQGTQPKFTDGKISSLTGLMDDPAEYQISVPVQPGNSGGPLVDLHGNVQGVIVARLDDSAALLAAGSLPQNVNYAVKGRLLRNFLSPLKQIKLAANKPVDAGSSAVEAVQKSVAIVLVY